MYLNVYVPQLQRVGGVVFLHAPSRSALRLDRAGGARRPRHSWPTSRSLSRRKVWIWCASASTSARTTSPAVSAAVRRRRKGSVRRAGPGEGARVAHRAAPLCRHRHELSVDGRRQRDGEPLLLLLRRRGLRPVLPEVLLLLPLQRQAVHQRPRVRQAAGARAASPSRRWTTASSRAKTPAGAAADLRSADRAQDRRPAAQMAGAAAASVHPARPGRRLPLRAVRSCRPSSR